MSGNLSTRLFAIPVAVILAAGVGLAQLKVAVVDLGRAVLETAEVKKLSKEMEAKYTPRQRQIEKVQKELQTLEQQAQATAGKLTPQAQADLEAQYQRKQRELQRLDEDLRADVSNERQEILTRSERKMRDLIRKLAEEKQFDLVVEKNDTLYFKHVLEITNDAIAAYDKAYPVK